jgi:hypothetical protein
MELGWETSRENVSEFHENLLFYSIPSSVAAFRKIFIKLGNSNLKKPPCDPSI